MTKDEAILYLVYIHQFFRNETLSIDQMKLYQQAMFVVSKEALELQWRLK